MIPSRNRTNGASTMANSTAVAPRTHETSPGIRTALMAHSIRIQVVLVIEVMPEALITLIEPENSGLYG